MSILRNSALLQFTFSLPTMKIRIYLIISLLFFTCSGFIFSQDTLNYNNYHFKHNVVFIDSANKSKCIVTEGSIPNDFVKYDNLKSIRIDCDPVLFSETIFDSLADFKLVRFKHNVLFWSASFLGRSSFAYDVFEDSASFCASIFRDSNIDFSSTSYDIDVKGGTSFIETQFNAPVDFRAVDFKNEVFFKDTKFNSSANFQSANFRKKAHFEGAVFSTILDFRFANFNEGASFGEATLPDTLYFDIVKNIGAELDFSMTRLAPNKKICYIYLIGSNIDKIRINYDQFKLFFRKLDADNDITSVYQKLLKKFKEDGCEDSYQKLDIEFQQYKYNKSNQWFRNWLQEWWWNYGYNKENIFINSLILLLFFFIVNMGIGIKWGYNFLAKEVYEVTNIVEEVERIETKYANKKIKLFFAWLPMVFTYTCMLFFILNLDIKHLKYKHKYALIYIVSVFMIGLACAAYIINFVLDK